MPILAAPGFEMSFADIERAKPDTLPEAVRPAAALIRQWLAGQDFFEMKTSGSTGEPKTILLKRHLIGHSARITQQAFQLKENDWLLLALSTDHIAGFMMVMRAVTLDCNLYVVPPASNPLLQIPGGQKIDFASFVPMQMQAMIDFGLEYRLNAIDKILVGGGILSDSLRKKIYRLESSVSQSYGMTETYSHVALRMLNTRDAEEAYWPLPGVELKQDERGCLCIKSEVTEGDWLVTNDIVQMLPEGGFFWLGRLDNIINTGGIKVQAEKVEQAVEHVLRETGGAASSYFVTGAPDNGLGEKVVLVIEGQHWSEEKKNNFLSRLSKLVTRYELPREIYFRQQFERTALGKIDKRRILAELNPNA